jgi:hypothetical protein
MTNRENAGGLGAADDDSRPGRDLRRVRLHDLLRSLSAAFVADHGSLQQEYLAVGQGFKDLLISQIGNSVKAVLRCKPYRLAIAS